METEGEKKRGTETGKKEGGMRQRVGKREGEKERGMGGESERVTR